MTGDAGIPPGLGVGNGAAEGEAPSRNARRDSGGERSEFLRRVAVELPRRDSLAEALGPALALLCEAGGWPLAGALLRPGRRAPTGSRTWHPAEAGPFSGLRDTTRALREEGRSDPLLSRLLDSPFPAFTADLGRDLDPERAEAARAAGLRALFVVPVLADGRVAAALELFSSETRAPRERQRKAVEVVRAPLELLAARDRARRAARAAGRRVALLRSELEPTVARLRDVEERYSLVCGAAEDGLWDWDLRLDRVSYSPRWKAILGYSAVQIGDRPSEWLDRIHPDDRERVELEIREHLERRTPRLESEHRVLHEDGTYRRVRVRGLALRDEEERPRRLAGSLSDITELRTLEARGVEELLYDPATGVASHALLLDRLRLTMGRSSRRLDHAFAVLAIHLDGLEEAKERLGGAAADELHGALARRLRLTTRAGDTVAHGVGRHFTVLLDDLRGARDALRIASRFESGLAGPIPLFEEEVRLVPRIGVGLGLSRYEEPEALLRDADHALQLARGRKAGVEVFDAADAEFDSDLEKLEDDLRTALNRGGLHLVYQPILSLDDGRVAGLEALLRWDHPTEGPIPPERFLSVAREAGLLERMSYWAFERACRQLRTWQDRLPSGTNPPPISLNVTGRQLFDPDLARRVTDAAKAAGVDFSLLQLEVPESACVQDPSRALQVLSVLRARGLRIAADDFGTGRLALGALHRLPLSALKIDRSFVSGRAGRERDWDVAATIVELGRILGMEVIAEGVETREACLRLRRVGCALAQGYYFSGPVAADEAERWIREGHPAAREAAAG